MSQEFPNGIATHPSIGEVPMVMGRLDIGGILAFIDNHPGRVTAVVEDVFEQKIEDLPPTSGVSSITSSTYPWGIEYLNADVCRGKGAGVSVYVLDTGVRITHNEFGGRAFAGVDVASSGVYPGTLTVCSPSSTTCADDQHGHGSHCAGTVGASTYGVADGATIWSMKVLDNGGSGYGSWSILAEQWIYSSGNRPAVVSISIQSNSNSFAEQTSIDNLVADGVTVVVAAGNYNQDACTYNPAWIESAITVAAFGGTSGSSWHRSSYSNWGSCIDVYAPGTSVLSLGPSSDTHTRSLTGTSMACPHVAGLAARMYERYPSAGSMTATARKDLLMSTSCTGCVTNAATPTPTVNLVALADCTTPTPAPTPSAASAVGDPHMVNIYGQRFDLMQPGQHTLVHIPRRAEAVRTLLDIQAEAKRIGTSCADMYIMSINVTGAWASAPKHPAGIFFSVQKSDQTLGWQNLGQVKFKVMQGHTENGIAYLNFLIRGLSKVEYSIGGLLGVDDHTDASKADPHCHKVSNLRASSP